MIERLRAAKPSMIYVIELAPFVTKIGVSNNPARRLRDFVPLYPFARLVWNTDIRYDPYSFEKLLKKRLAKWSVGNELFSFPADRIVSIAVEVQAEMDATPYKGELKPKYRFPFPHAWEQKLEPPASVIRHRFKAKLGR